VASKATLQTLAERIDRGEARRLAAQVPLEIAQWLATTSPVERFDVDGFLRRVARREGVGVEIVTARRHAEAVLAALARAVGDNELADLTAELPKDFAALLPRSPESPRDVGGLFLAKRGGPDRTDAGEAEARRATDVRRVAEREGSLARSKWPALTLQPCSALSERRSASASSSM
jgi:uncharacterized protein (DUF2267 family)